MDLDSESESVKRDDEDDTTINDDVDGDDGNDKEAESVTTGVVVDAWTEGVNKLPTEPTGLCSASLQDRINKLYQRKRVQNYDMNAVIQSKKGFRNPSIYEKLIQFCGIDEHGTNFPKELYDGHLFGRESYYDELAKVQKSEMERREKAKAGGAKSAADVASATAASVMKKAEELKRKSKWDQVTLRFYLSYSRRTRFLQFFLKCCMLKTCS